MALVRDEASSDPQNPGRGLVWLVGVDGNDTPAQSPAERAVQQRMLGRRAHQVAVPPQDCLPTGAPDPFNDGTCERPAP